MICDGFMVVFHCIYMENSTLVIKEMAYFFNVDKDERVERFRKIQEMTEEYRRENQYE